MKEIKKHIKYPETGQFSTIVKNILHANNYVGLDENGDAVYDPTIEKPVLIAKSTVKIHGTNSGVSYNNEHGIWVQSRTNIITPEKDNAGFAFHVMANKEWYINSIKEFSKLNNIDLDNHTVTVYGEWAGTGIQKNVGINNQPKGNYIFAFKISRTSDTDFTAYWIDVSSFPRNEECNIYNIYDFETKEIEIDFNRPKLAQNEMIEIMLDVEKHCPVAKKLGHEGIGEGNVWTVEFKDKVYRFKVKGDKHAGKSKVKKLKPVDNVKLNKIHECVNKVTPNWRLDQMITESCDLNNGGQIERSKIGSFIKMVINDIIKEELDTISEYNLEPKEINKYVSNVAKEYFFVRESEDLGL